MQAIPYKEYLVLFTKYHKKSLNVPQLFLSFVVAIALAFSVSLGITNNKNQQIEPARNQVAYYETASSSFIKASQSMDDLFASLQVAGAKIEKIDDLKESTPTPGFFVALAETQNTIAKIDQARENIAFQKDVISKLETPTIYSGLTTELFAYLDQSDKLLAEIRSKQTELKDLLIATGPNFFLPVLSNETLWESKDVASLETYYKDQKLEAQKSMTNFQKIPTSLELASFKETQLTYYQLLINVSDNVLNVLAKASAPDQDPELVVEEAYQVLTGAKRDNEFIAAKLLGEKLHVATSANYNEKVNRLNNQKRTIESGMQSSKAQSVSAPIVVQNNSNNLFDFSWVYK